MLDINFTNSLSKPLGRDEFLDFISTKSMGSEHIEIIFGKQLVRDYEHALKAIKLYQFSLDKTHLSSRVLNHWTEKGLLADNRPDGSKQWRKFSFLDLVWIRIFDELRGFGMSLNAMKTSYDIASSGLAGMPDAFTDYILFSATGYPLYLFVSAEGQTSFSTYPSAGQSFNSSYVTIRIHRILGELTGAQQSYYELERPNIELSKKDKQIFEIIGQPDWKQVILHNSSNDKIHCEIVKQADLTQPLNQIMHGVDFGKIQINRQKGKNTHAEIRKTKRIDR